MDETTPQYYVYILKSLKDSKFYIGITNNLQRRIHEHNSGQEKSTKSRIPFILVHSELHISRLEARKKEKYLKSGQGRDWIYKNYKDK